MLADPLQGDGVRRDHRPRTREDFLPRRARPQVHRRRMVGGNIRSRWDPIQIEKAREKFFTPVPFTALGWSVPDIKAEVARLSKNGVVFERIAERSG